MSILIGDDSAIGTLIRTDNINNLPLMYDRVVIPKAVENELKHPNTPEKIRNWMENPSIQLEVLEARQIDKSLNLDKGEKEVISLGQELKKQGEEVRLLIDEKKARRVAEKQDFKVIGTYGILGESDKRGFVNSDTEIKKIEIWNKENPGKEFRVSDKVKKEILDKYEQIESKREQAGIKETPSQDTEWRRFEVRSDGKESRVAVSGLYPSENQEKVRQTLNGNVQDILAKQEIGEELKIRIPKEDESKKLNSPQNEENQKKVYEFEYKGKTYEKTGTEQEMKTFLSQLKDIQEKQQRQEAQQQQIPQQQQPNNQNQSY